VRQSAVNRRFRGRSATRATSVPSKVLSRVGIFAVQLLRKPKRRPSLVALQQQSELSLRNMIEHGRAPALFGLAPSQRHG
jgi:hypothetical protein